MFRGCRRVVNGVFRGCRGVEYLPGPTRSGGDAASAAPANANRNLNGNGNGNGGGAAANRVYHVVDNGAGNAKDVAIRVADRVATRVATSVATRVATAALNGAAAHRATNGAANGAANGVIDADADGTDSVTDADVDADTDGDVMVHDNEAFQPKARVPMTRPSKVPNLTAGGTGAQAAFRGAVLPGTIAVRPAPFPPIPAMFGWRNPLWAPPASYPRRGRRTTCGGRVMGGLHRILARIRRSRRVLRCCTQALATGQSEEMRQALRRGGRHALFSAFPLY